MVYFPFKRVWALVGAPRSGKDTVAKFLKETRKFETLAFADQIKKEYGISLEDFEASKHTDEIDTLRDNLWKFSAQKKKNNPNYFINPVLQAAKNNEKSIVITDVRTENEWECFMNMFGKDKYTKIYTISTIDDCVKNNIDYKITGTNISTNFYWKQYWATGVVRRIDNDTKSGLFNFYKKLENYFFKEDIMDLVGPGGQICDSHRLDEWRFIISKYVDQFNLIEK